MGIEEIEKRYEILKSGKVRSRRRDRIMSPFLDRNGYECILLQVDGKKYVNCRIHRLVAEKYLGSLKNRYVIHVDDDIRNNDVSNLLLVDRGVVLTIDEVRDIRSSMESCAVLGKRYGVSRSLISQIRNNRIWRED